MNSLLDILSDSILFGGLPEAQLREIGRIAESRRYAKAQIVFTEGDEGVGFFVIASGTVKIFKVSSDGKEQILHIFGPGEPFGEVPVFTNQAYPASAEAIAPTTLLFIPKGGFIQLISRTPSLSLNMLAVLSLRLHQFTVQVENLSLKEVPGRLAGYLLYLGQAQRSENEVRLAISKGQLASLLGTIPETLSRVLAKMSQQRIITVSGRRIRLLDTEALNALAAHGKYLDA